MRAGRVLDILDAKKDPARKVALFFVHGGGWRNGSRTIFHEIAQAYRELGFDCATTDYRLSGVRIDDQIADIREALSIFQDDLRLRGKSQNVVLIGSSAGAHLALLSALKPGAPAGIQGVCVQAAPFTFEPWTDIFPGIWSAMETAVGATYSDAPERFREASPIHYIHKGMPAVFALHAENEHMFPLALTTDFAEAVTALGGQVKVKTYPATEHGFFYALSRHQQQEAFADILHFIETLPSS